MATPSNINLPVIQLDIVKDKLGNDVTINYANMICVAPEELLIFYYNHAAELLKSGHGTTWVGINNKARAIYIEIDSKIVGHIVFDYYPDKRKTFIILSAVDKEYRGRGLYAIMHKEFESMSLKLGAVEIASFVHVDNISRQKSAEKVGFLPTHYRMFKRLV
jgi:RimJ/RimL family protein N-acetyltransferase